MAREGGSTAGLTGLFNFLILFAYLGTMTELVRAVECHIAAQQQHLQLSLIMEVRKCKTVLAPDS